MYRRITSQERLAIGLRLHELSCDIAREGIPRQLLADLLMGIWCEARFGRG